jgi:hypothetical protein
MGVAVKAGGGVPEGMVVAAGVDVTRGVAVGIGGGELQAEKRKANITPSPNRYILFIFYPC